MVETTGDGRTSFRFLDLPPEIRNLVYQNTLTLTPPVQLRAYRDGTEMIRNVTLAPRLLLCCRQIKDEAITILYGGNTFATPGGDVEITYGAAAFFDQIGAENCKLIRKFEIGTEYQTKWSIYRLCALLEKRLSKLQILTLRFSTWHIEKFSMKELAGASMLRRITLRKKRKGEADDGAGILRWKYEDKPKAMVMVNNLRSSWLYEGRRRSGVEDGAIQVYGAEVVKLISKRR